MLNNNKEDLINIGDIFMYSLLKNPDRIAVIYGDKKYSYKEIAELISGFQYTFLKKINYLPNIVAFKLSNSVEYVVTYFALTLMGIVIQPIYDSSEIKEIKNVLKASGAQFLISEKKLDLGENVTVLKKIPLFHEKHKKIINIKQSRDKMAILLTSSGTTNDPKVIAHSHYNMIVNCQMHVNSIHLKQGSLGLVTLPLAFGYANLTSLLSHFYVNGGIILYSELSFIPKVASLLEQYPVNDFTAVPVIITGLTYFYSKRKKKINNIKEIKVLFGGGTITENNYIQFKNIFNQNVKIIQTYGCTECGPRISTKIIGATYDSKNLGRPFPQIKVQIKNINNKGWGEIEVLTPTKMLGYMKNGYLDIDKNKNFLPGDICKINSEGEIIFCSRKGNVLKHHGFNIVADEIENYIYNNVNAEFTVKLYQQNDLLILDVQAKDKDILTKIKSVIKQLPMQKRPDIFHTVNLIERTKNNKIRRN